MAEIETLFVTKVYRAELDAPSPVVVTRACKAVAAADKAGRSWSKANKYKGYTSYSSLTDLPERSPEFADLKRVIDSHVAAFCDVAAFK